MAVRLRRALRYSASPRRCECRMCSAPPPPLRRRALRRSRTQRRRPVPLGSPRACLPSAHQRVALALHRGSWRRGTTRATRARRRRGRSHRRGDSASTSVVVSPVSPSCRARHRQPAAEEHSDEREVRDALRNQDAGPTRDCGARCEGAPHRAGSGRFRGSDKLGLLL